MPFISVLGKPNKELTVHEAMEFHSRLCFMLGLPTPLIFDRQVFYLGRFEEAGDDRPHRGTISHGKWPKIR